MWEYSQSHHYKPTVEEILGELDDPDKDNAEFTGETLSKPTHREDNLRRPIKHHMENSQIEPTAESLAKEFFTFGKVAAEHVILKARTVARAKAELGYNENQEFGRLVRLDPRSSTYRKYKLIGAEADWLLSIAAHLPGDWTTIYDVVRLGQVKAEEMVRSGTLHPQVTAKELKAASTAEVSGDVLAETNTIEADEAIGTAERCVFQIDASDLSDADRLVLYRDLEQAVFWLNLTVTGLPNRLAEKHVMQREAAS